ncbi:MAG: L-seryl-tRNA(Sec) selenium transferase, partial [Planctomycetota bacterium]
MTLSNQQILRNLPSVDALLKDSDLQNCAGELGRQVVTNSIRQVIEEIRELILAEALAETDEDGIRRKIIADVKHRLTTISQPHYRRVINATGIILHTALGRAVLPAQALHQIQDEMSGYSLLQTDIETGKRSKRDGCIEQLLQQLTGAEAATVVNNNAAATSIVLNTVADGKEVIVSRGQLVEIGGAFRLPDVMAFSGAKLV